jgi:hypothetical protein
MGASGLPVEDFAGGFGASGGEVFLGEENYLFEN